MCRVLSVLVVRDTHMGNKLSTGCCFFRARAESEDTSQNNILTGSNSDPLYLLSLLFRIFGFPIDPTDHIYWKIYHYLVISCLLISFIGLIISSIDQLNEDIFNTMSAIFFSLTGIFSYICLSITVYSSQSHQYNLLNIIQEISKDSLVTRSLNHHHHLNLNTSSNDKSQESLKYFCYKWLGVAGGIGLLSFSLLFVAYGRHGDTHFFDVGHNPGWHVANILYLYYNAGWLMPMVLVRVSCHFFERKIFNFIEYLEEPEMQEITPQRSQSSIRPPNSVDSHRSCLVSPRILSAVHSLASTDVLMASQQHNSIRLGAIASSRISIKQIMSWYDELYALNQLLSNGFSLLIFQMIVCLFPLVVFMLQVKSLLPLAAQMTHFSRAFSCKIFLLRPQWLCSIGSARIPSFSLL